MKNKTTDVSNAVETDIALNHEGQRDNAQAAQKRKRWFLKRGKDGVWEPLNLFGGIKVSLNMNPDIVNQYNMPDNCIDNLNTEPTDSQNVPEADAAINELKEKHTLEAAPRRTGWFEHGGKKTGDQPRT